MQSAKFLKGMGLGMAMGAALGAAMQPKRKSMKTTAGKAMKAMGEMADNISDAMG